MLKSLSIQNLATIESLAIEFAAGLNALTGETGAGKTVLVEGLELALGGRASADVVRAGERLAAVEAEFVGPLPEGLGALLERFQIEHAEGEPLVLRRELAAGGRSRCFISGQMVGVGELRQLGELLVDFHGQHEHQSLFRPDAARGALDAWGNHEDLLRRCREAYEAALGLRRRRAELEAAARDFEKRAEWLDYQLEEFERVAPQAGETAALEREEKLLARAEALGLAAAEAYGLLYEGEDERPAVLALLSEVRRRVEELAEVEPTLADGPEKLAGAAAALEELAYTLRDAAERIEADPERLERVIERLEGIRKLTRKHGGNEAAMLAAWGALREEREKMSRDDAERREVAGRLAEAEAMLAAAAAALHTARAAAAARFAREVEGHLRQLAMERARLEVALEPLDTAGPEGADRVELLLAANPGLPPAPLRRIGSGGEISRVMLAIKTALAGRDAIPTLVFDEIDAGVGGEAARRIGHLLERLGRDHQVLCITHLAPIAARAAMQFQVSKRIGRGATITRVDPLAGEARLAELARMMGGDGAARAARDLARELMD